MEYLKSYNKDQLPTVIKSQANISGYILDGKVVSKEEFEEIVDTLSTNCREDKYGTKGSEAFNVKTRK